MKPNVPCVFTSRAAFRKAPSAIRESAEPRLIRRTPAAASCSTESGVGPSPPSTFTGRPTAAQSVRIGSTSRGPGA